MRVWTPMERNLSIFTGSMTLNEHYIDEINTHYGSAPGSHFLYNGSNIEDFATYIKKELCGRIDGLITNDYDPEIVLKRLGIESSKSEIW
jgi:hypothetical protein